MSSGTSAQPYLGLNQTGRDPVIPAEQPPGEAWADETYFTDDTGWID